MKKLDMRPKLKTAEINLMPNSTKNSDLKETVIDNSSLYNYYTGGIWDDFETEVVWEKPGEEEEIEMSSDPVDIIIDTYDEKDKGIFEDLEKWKEDEYLRESGSGSDSVVLEESKPPYKREVDYEVKYQSIREKYITMESSEVTSMVKNAVDSIRKSSERISEQKIIKKIEPQSL